MTGRTSTYNVETATRICELIAEGNSLASVCKADDMPTRATVYEWLEQQPAFADSYARARERQADSFADDIQAIADDINPNDRFSVEAAKAQVSARQWIAAKIRPGKYGDRQHVELSGSLTLTDVLRQAAELRKSRDEPE